MSTRLPDRWLPYSNIGKRIEGTPFIAFKVPLDKKFFRSNNDIEEDMQFSPAMLIESEPKLKLVIDLTATDRYYNPSIFRQSGIEYRKIKVPGKQVPSKIYINKFSTIINDFLKNVQTDDDEERLIGVHCTHGVNRTGFLVCAFMIKHLNMDAETAISRFNEARGYEMERENYKAELKKLKAGTDSDENETNDESNKSDDNYNYDNYERDHNSKRNYYKINNSDRYYNRNHRMSNKPYNSFNRNGTRDYMERNHINRSNHDDYSFNRNHRRDYVERNPSRDYIQRSDTRYYNERNRRDQNDHSNYYRSNNYRPYSQRNNFNEKRSSYSSYNSYDRSRYYIKHSHNNTTTNNTDSQTSNS